MNNLQNLKVKQEKSYTAFPSVFELSSINGQNGFQVVYKEEEYYIGPYAFSGLGDFNGDGVDDFFSSGGRINTCYVILGRKNWDLKLYDPSNDQVGSIEILNGECGTYLDAYKLGDINGDGLSDVILGNKIVFGSRTFRKMVDVDKLDGLDGFEINVDFSGYDEERVYIKYLGDINRDGRSDLGLTGAGRTGAYPGLNVMFGKSSFPALLNVTLEYFEEKENGFIVSCSNKNAQVIEAAPVGDINGDGINDLSIGYNSKDSYSVLVIFGSNSFNAPIIIPDQINGVNGFVINSELEAAYLNVFPYPLGDINGDKIDDFSLVISDKKISKSIVVYGNKESKYFTYIDFFNLKQGEGFSVGSLDNARPDIFSVGDINGDEMNDVAFYVYPKETSRVLYGSNNLPLVVTESSFDGVHGFSIIQDGCSNCLNQPLYSGDVNGDGIDDVYISGFYSGSAYPSYMIFGERSSVLPTSSPGPSVHPEEDNTGAIVGGVIGGLAAVGLAVGMFMYGRTHGWFGAQEMGEGSHLLAEHH